MTVGELRERATLIAAVETNDGKGGQTAAWTNEVAEVSAAIVPVSGREALASGAMQSSLGVRITIRYRSDVTAAMRLRRERDGQVYELVGPPRDVDGRQRWLELEAQEVRA